MSLPKDGAGGAVQAAFVRATADDYEDHTASHPDLVLQIDYYVPMWTSDAGDIGTRVLVITGAKWRVSAIEAFLKALTRPDDEEVATCDESPF